MKNRLLILLMCSLALSASETQLPHLREVVIKQMVERKDLDGIFALLDERRIDVHALLNSTINWALVKDDQGRSMMHHFAMHTVPGFELFAQKYPQLLGEKDAENRLPFFYASAVRNTPVITTILTLQPHLIKLPGMGDVVFDLVNEGNFEVFKTIMDWGLKNVPKKDQAILKFRDQVGRTVLHYACRSLRKQIVAYLLKNFPQMHKEIDDDGATPLHQACVVRSSEVDEEIPTQDAVAIVKLLVQHDPTSVDSPRVIKNKRWHLGYLPIFEAALSHNVPIVEYFLHVRPDLIHAQTPDGSSLLDIACSVGSMTLITMLEHRYPKDFEQLVRKQNKSGLNLLHYAVMSDDNTFIATMTKRYPELIVQPDANGFSPLICAVNSDNVILFSHYLELHEVFNEKLMRDLLKHICLQRAHKTFQLFLSSFGDIFSHAHTGVSKSEMVAYTMWPELLEELLQYCPGLVHCENEYGDTLLHVADKELAFGNDFDEEAQSKRTLAKMQGKTILELVALLVQYGADWKKKDHTGAFFYSSLPQAVKIKVLTWIKRFEYIKPLVESCLERKEYDRLQLLPQALSTAFSSTQLSMFLQMTYNKADDKTQVAPLLKAVSQENPTQLVKEYLKTFHNLE